MALTSKPRIIDVGYTKDELTFVEEPPKLLELECPICLQVMLNDPHLVSCCGHHFCGPCIKKIQEDKGSCPVCKQLDYQAMVDKSTQRNINGLHVYCINNKEGCKWKGELKDLSSHLQQGKREGECQYVRVCCKHRCSLNSSLLSSVYVQCEFKDHRWKVSKHETNDCLYRPYICKYCGCKEIYGVISGIHYLLVCTKYPVVCPNNCKQSKIPRHQLKDHLDTSCPLQPVECEYSWAGCEVKFKREDYHKHCSDNLQQHLYYVAKTCQEENEKLKKENAKIMKENAVLKKESDEIKKEIAILKARLKNPFHLFQY